MSWLGDSDVLSAVGTFVDHGERLALFMPINQLIVESLQWLHTDCLLPDALYKNWRQQNDSKV